MNNAERLRRVRLNDHGRYLRNRYGYELPDGDDGREDLYELLLTISLGDGADRKMRHAIELWAPWMSSEETAQESTGLTRRRITSASAQSATSASVGVSPMTSARHGGLERLTHATSARRSS